jgi:hypothetical protein
MNRIRREFQPYAVRNTCATRNCAGISQHPAQNREHWIISFAEVQFDDAPSSELSTPRAIRHESVRDRSCATDPYEPARLLRFAARSLASLAAVRFFAAAKLAFFARAVRSSGVMVSASVCRRSCRLACDLSHSLAEDGSSFRAHANRLGRFKT